MDRQYDVRDFWMMEHEVTFAEYLEFVNDPEVLAEIDSSDEPMRVPRFGGVVRCERGEDGMWRIPGEWAPDWPAFGVSWEDAKAFAEWKTRRAKEAGLDYVYDLPTLEQWALAWCTVHGAPYPFGNVFRPKWVSSNYARPSPWPEPVMSFPVDRSPLGIYDLSGSVTEWLKTPWTDRTMRIEGGSWGHGGFNHHEMFTLYGGNGAIPDTTTGTLGFRLVLTIDDANP